MDNVLTLVSHREFELTQKLVDQLSDEIRRHGGILDDQNWLAPGQAVDIFYRDGEADIGETVAQNLLSGLAVDFLSQSATNRRKRLLVADMDSTIVEGETLDDLAEIVGIGSEIAAITARAMNGEMNFEEALHERIAMLKGVHTSVLQQTADTLVLNPGAKTLIRTMSVNGAYTALVSGGFRFFTQLVADQVGFDFNHGNQLEIADDHLTGSVIPPIVTKDVKVETLNRLARERSISPADAVTVGDGANDLPMLQAAGLGVAYYAKPVVLQQAPARVAHSDLETLLYYQGYAAVDFVS